MAKITIVGGGFAAGIASLILGDGADVVTPVDNTLQLSNFHIRRPAIELNKIFSKNAKSFGDLEINLKNGTLHDRLVLGGNSSVWGGFVDEREIPGVVKAFLKGKGVHMVPLGLELTGSASNMESISQFQSQSGRVFDAAQILKPSINGYLESFTTARSSIDLNVRLSAAQGFNSKTNYSELIMTDKLILCVGVVQLIELLYKSKLLHEGDKISFSEFNCRFQFSSSVVKKSADDGCTIQYTIGRAIWHALGIRKYSKVMRMLDKLPLYINQEFSHKKSKFVVEICERKLVDVGGDSSEGEGPFGKSIHYCDMQINGVDINEYLSKIDPNILGLGMAFVKQNRPGPISNDIMIDAYKKLT